ncbi:MAG: hypothetical protein D6689_00020 [Deltaproteobacteria bacterium]|nr:MAG: hypothetical protein D6689_00020 [Deltaproteobacteria bacterium]
MTNLVKQVRQVAGVDIVRVVDFKAGVFEVRPKRGKRPSPRAVWDAVGKAGFTAAKLVTPERTYTKRPPEDAT